MDSDRNQRTILGSLKRGLGRNLLLVGIGLIVYQLVEALPLFFGEVGAPMARNLSLSLVFFVFVDVLMRVWQPYLDNRQLGDIAETTPLSAAVIYAARMFLLSIMLAVFTMSARAETGANDALEQAQRSVIFTPGMAITPQVQNRITDYYIRSSVETTLREMNADSVQLVQFVGQTRPSGITTMPTNAVKNSPLLVQEMQNHWSTMKTFSLNAAQIEQETCIRLNHPTCWTSDAQLNVKSSSGIEKGRGFGQLTAVWRANGALRFDNVGTMRVKYPRELGNYGWNNWNDPQLSMRAYVLFMRDTCKAVPTSVVDEVARFQMCLSGYNGGMGGLSNDILSCRATQGCDPTLWTDNVERTSAKAKLAVKGYGQSSFDINRGYVSKITVERRVRYLSLDAKRTTA